MADFFECINLFYQQKKFCDLNITNLWPSDPNFSETILCHSIVLSSVVPNLGPLLKSCGGQEDVSVIVIQGDVCSSVSETVDNVYSSLSSKKSTEEWSQAILGKWSSNLTPEPDLNEEETSLEKGCREQNQDGRKTFQTSRERSMKYQKDDQEHEILEETEPKINSVISLPATLTENETKIKKGALKRKSLKRGQCPECLEILPTANSTERRQFLLHKLGHFKCDCPNIVFTSATAFSSHMTSVHSDKKNLSLKCPHGKCHALFFSQGALDRHVRQRHTNSLENGVGKTCEECNQTFVNSHHLNIHNRHRHAEIECSQCREICIGKLDYNRHLQKVHTKPELCDYCGKSFTLKKFLKNHVINVHLTDSDKPYRCDLCGKGFVSKVLLRDHIAVHHNNKKPYECRATNCDRAFTTSACRKRHELKVHQLNISLKRGAISKYVIHDLKTDISEEAC